MVGRRLVAVLVAGWALLPPDAQACSVCVGWPEGQGLNGGFYWSALLLTALPFVVVGIIGAWLTRAARLSRSRRTPATPKTASTEKR